MILRIQVLAARHGRIWVVSWIGHFLDQENHRSWILWIPTWTCPVVFWYLLRTLAAHRPRILAWTRIYAATWTWTLEAVCPQNWSFCTVIVICFEIFAVAFGPSWTKRYNSLRCNMVCLSVG